MFTGTSSEANQDTVISFDLTFYPDRVARGDAGSTAGCGNAFSSITSLISLADVEAECDQLTKCYHSCDETKVACDLEFKALLRSKCNDVIPTSTAQGLCYTVVDQMHTIVNTGGIVGSMSYADAQRANCVSPSTPTRAPVNPPPPLAGNGTINVCVSMLEVAKTEPVENATVQCFDGDLSGTPETMTEPGQTGTDGCVNLTYTRKPVWDPIGPYPDVYCKVTKDKSVYEVRIDQYRRVNAHRPNIHRHACDLPNSGLLSNY